MAKPMKKASMKKAAKKGVKKVSQRDGDLIRKMHQDGVAVLTIQSVMGVGKSTVHKFAKKTVVKRQGPPTRLAESDKKKVVETLEDLQEKHGSKRMVTAEDVAGEWAKKHPSKVISARAVKKILRKDGLNWHRPTQKIQLAPEHAKERRDWCKKNLDNDPFSFDCIIDGTQLKVPRTRAHFLKLEGERIKGVWRRKGESMIAAAVVHNKRLATNMGKPNLYLSAIFPLSGKVEYIAYEGPWCAIKCVEVYEKLAKLLKKHAGKKAEYRILQDNDPTGFKARLSEEFAKRHGWKMPFTPRYSPDLVCSDYFLHKQVKNAVVQRLSKLTRGSMTNRDHNEIVKQCALELCPAQVKKSVASLKRRVREILENKGWHING
jgi:transposase